MSIALQLDEVKAGLAKLSADDLEKEYPIDVFGQPMTTGWFLTHLATHLSYHLGQINYLIERRKCLNA